MNVFIVSIPNEVEGKKEKYANAKWILRDPLCSRSNLGND